MFRYSLTIFLGAFLLFQVQPIAAKALLPRFGGVAAVWMTAMLFFQLVLLLGYLYVYLLQRFVGPKRSCLIQSAIALLACVTLPVAAVSSSFTSVPESLTWSVVKQLTAMVGPVFFALSATGPLIQWWQSVSHPERSPFRLYALSNFGSLAGLLAYPLLIEPSTGLVWQQLSWSWSYLAYAVLLTGSGYQVWKAQPQAGKFRAADVKPLSLYSLLWWLLLTAVASAMLMSSTNLLCQEVASFPFLWVLPLTAYLLTFMICFERPQWYRRRPAILLLLVSGLASLLLFHLGTIASLVWHMLGFTVVCFATGMLCHGELERSKPSAEQLTLFYLVLSIGGLLGSSLVVLVMPHLLTRYFDFQGTLLLAAGIGVAAVLGGLLKRDGRLGWQAGGWLFAGLFVGLMCISSILISQKADQREGIVFRNRSEYGLVAIADNGKFREMINGQTRHGRQFLSPDLKSKPIDYYDLTSGVGLAFQYLQDRSGASETGKLGLNAGVIGLGGGVLATWLRPGDEMRFYEVNPQVVDLAEKWFSYLADAKGRTSVAVGDARVQLRQELSLGSQRFDLLVVDAFSSDSIPAHLLTRECQQLYWEHLKPDGILAIHISNRYLDLRPVLRDAGGVEGVEPYLFERRRTGPDVQECIWVLLTRDSKLADDPRVVTVRTNWPRVEKVVWTDDFNSAWPLIDWGFWVDWSSLRPDQRARGK